MPGPSGEVRTPALLAKLNFISGPEMLARIPGRRPWSILLEMSESLSRTGKSLAFAVIRAKNASKFPRFLFRPMQTREDFLEVIGMSGRRRRQKKSIHMRCPGRL
jgi:hypothetical protein